MRVTFMRYFLHCWTFTTENLFGKSKTPMYHDLRLRKCPLFNEIADLALVSLEAQVRWKHLKPEEMVCRKGDPADGLYILIRGSLLVFDLLHNGQEVSLNLVSTGDFFGELSVIDHLPRTAYIKATQDSLVGLIPKSVAQDFFTLNP